MKKEILLSLILFVIISFSLPALSFGENVRISSPAKRAQVKYYIEQIKKGVYVDWESVIRLKDKRFVPIFIEQARNGDYKRRAWAVSTLSSFKDYIIRNPEFLDAYVSFLLQDLEEDVRRDSDGIRSNARVNLMNLANSREPRGGRFPREDIEKTSKKWQKWWKENKDRLLKQAAIFKQEDLLREKEAREISLLKEEKEEKFTLAVIFVSPDSLLEKSCQIMSEILRGHLSKLENIQLVEWEEIKLLLDEIDLSHSGLIDEKTAQKAGLALGADYLIMGSLYREQGEVKTEIDFWNILSNKLVPLVSETVNINNLDLQGNKIADLIYQKLKGETREQKVAQETRKSTREGKVKLAVMNFQNNSVDNKLSSLEEGLPALLSSDLSQYKEIDLVSRENLDKISDELKLEKSGLAKKESIKIGRMSGADKIILGSFQAKKDSISFSVRFIDTETGKIWMTKTVSGKIGAFSQLEKEIVKEIIGCLEVKEEIEKKEDRQRAKLLSEIYLRNSLDAFSNMLFDEALVWAENALFVRSDFLEAEDITVRLYEHKKNYFKAINKYLYLINKYPQEKAVPDWLFHLGCIYYAQGQEQKAIEHFERIVNEYPHFDSARHSKKYIPFMRYYAKRKYDLTAYYSFAVPNPFPKYLNYPISDTNVIAYFLAAYYDDKKDFLEALKFYEISVSFEGYSYLPWLLEGLYRIGEIYEQKGDMKKALKYYRKAQELSLKRSRGEIYKKATAKIASLKGNSEKEGTKITVLQVPWDAQRLFIKPLINKENFIVSLIVNKKNFVIYPNLELEEINSNSLSNCNILILPTLTKFTAVAGDVDVKDDEIAGRFISPILSRQEIDAIDTFVKKGGNLFVTLTYTANKEDMHYQDLLSHFGVGIDNFRRLDKEGRFVSLNKEQPIFTDLNKVWINRALPLSTEESRAIMKFNNEPVLLAFNWGKGKVVVSSLGTALTLDLVDCYGVNRFWNNSYLPSEVFEINKKLLLNILNWFSQEK